MAAVVGDMEYAPIIGKKPKTNYSLLQKALNKLVQRFLFMY